MKYIKRLIIVLPVIAGIGLFAFMKMNRKAPERMDGRERVRAVRVMPLKRQFVLPRITGYGYVAADRTWQAIPEVSGRIVQMMSVMPGIFLNFRSINST